MAGPHSQGLSQPSDPKRSSPHQNASKADKEPEAPSSTGPPPSLSSNSVPQSREPSDFTLKAHVDEGRSAVSRTKTRLKPTRAASQNSRPTPRPSSTNAHDSRGVPTSAQRSRANSTPKRNVDGVRSVRSFVKTGQKPPSCLGPKSRMRTNPPPMSTPNPQEFQIPRNRPLVSSVSDVHTHEARGAFSCTRTLTRRKTPRPPRAATTRLHQMIRRGSPTNRLLWRRASKRGTAPCRSQMCGTKKFPKLSQSRRKIHRSHPKAS